MSYNVSYNNISIVKNYRDLNFKGNLHKLLKKEVLSYADNNKIKSILFYIPSVQSLYLSETL